MGNTAIKETAVARGALGNLLSLLPGGWELRREPAWLGADKKRGEAVTVLGPRGAAATFVVEARRAGAVPVSLLIPVLREAERLTGMPALFLSDYVGPTMRQALTAEDFSFVDATGWARVVSADPPIVLVAQGADRSPGVPRSNAVTRLNGVAANRIIRALTQVDLPIGVRDLASRAGVSPGSVAKLLVTLSAEAIIERGEDRGVSAVNGRSLMRRWAADYSFTKSNPFAQHFIAPRGLERTLERLAECPGIVMTGSVAARRLLPASAVSVVPLRMLAGYTADPVKMARELRLIEADPSVANVILAQPQDANILTEPAKDELALAPIPLVIADLLTLPGRSDAEAEQLMDALAATHKVWEGK